MEHGASGPARSELVFPLEVENKLSSSFPQCDLERPLSRDAGQLSRSVVGFPRARALFVLLADPLAFKAGVYGTMPEVGHGIPHHGACALGPVKEGDAAARNKLAGNPHVELSDRLPLHFDQRQGATRLFMDLAPVAPG